jgi:TPR repeat protein
VQLYTQACDGGEPRGCTALGVAYEDGKGGLTKDVARAVQLYTQACDGGDMDGCANATRLEP